jgi:hypothetical protein
LKSGLPVLKWLTLPPHESLEAATKPAGRETGGLYHGQLASLLSDFPQTSCPVFLLSVANNLGPLIKAAQAGFSPAKM